MRYIRPTPSTKLEGFILGYGSSFFSNQYIPLPSNRNMYMTEVDAEPRYLIAVRPVSNNKKSCSGKTKTHKPLQLVIGTLTPTSAFLSWGILVNPKHDWTTMNNCANDRFYTVRYREKDKNKKWILQLCPTTETVVDNLKPNTIYEFGVKDNTDDGIWSKSFIYKLVIPSKNNGENGELQDIYNFPKIQTKFIPDSRTFIPVKVIKQVIQNITHRTQSDILKKSPLSGPILVHLIVPDFNATKLKPPFSSRLDIFEKPKQSVATTEQDLERSKPTVPHVSKDSAVNQAQTESALESSKPSKAPISEIPLVTLDLHRFLGLPKARPSPTPQMPTEPSVSKEMQPVPLEPKTPVPKTIPTKAAVTNEPTLESFPSKTSKTLDWPRATLAPSEIPFITLKWKASATPERWHDKPVSTLPSAKQNIPKSSRITEKLKTPTAEKELQPKTTASTTFKIPELTRMTMVPRGQKFPVSTPQFLPHLEEPKITLAVTNKLVPLPATTKISVTDGHPVATLASKEINPVTSKSKEFDYTKSEEPVRKFVSTEDNYLPKLLTTPEFPITKPVSAEDDNYFPKILTTSEPPITEPASSKPSRVPTQPKQPDYSIPEVPDMKHVPTEDDNYLPKVLTTPELPITKSESYKPVQQKYNEPDYIIPTVPDKKHVSTVDAKYIPKVLTSPKLPITKPVSYEPSPVQSKFKDPGYIIAEVTDRTHVSTEDDNYLPKVLTTPDLPITKSDTYKPSPVPPTYNETNYIMPAVPDKKHVSTVDNKHLLKVFTTPDLPITKSVSTEDDNYLPKVLTMPDLPITKSDSFQPSQVPPKYNEPDYIMPAVPKKKHVSTMDYKHLPKVLTTSNLPIPKSDTYKPSPVPPKYNETDYLMPPVPDRKHVSTEDDNYLPNVLTTPDLPIAKSVSTEDDHYLPKVLNTSDLPITKSVSTEDNNYLPKVLTTPDLPITKSDSYKPSPVPPKYNEPDYIMPAVHEKKHGRVTFFKYFFVPMKFI
ncbi:target of Nesh-SH3-like [Erythrolamprus reginae]|uniref:target of Nesh-SH3-like n=1 Tax=Erythrolamprus reginae TaxID=121349 RepID=UPI00396C6F15